MPFRKNHRSVRASAGRSFVIVISECEPGKQIIRASRPPRLRVTWTVSMVDPWAKRETGLREK
jgi:hypothetical protein